MPKQMNSTNQHRKRQQAWAEAIIITYSYSQNKFKINYSLLCKPRNHMSYTYYPYKFIGISFVEKKGKHIVNEIALVQEKIVNCIVHPVSKKTITKYTQLTHDFLARVVWLHAMCKELGRLTHIYDEIRLKFHTIGIALIGCLDLEKSVIYYKRE